MTVGGVITVDDVVKALALPDRCRVDQRVPKKMLAEHGAPTAADRRLLMDGIEELQWLAALKPGTVGVSAFRDDGREYLELAVLVVYARATYGKPFQMLRMAELVHRAVPYPVLLIESLKPSTATAMTDIGATHVALSVAHKRASQNEAGKVVLDGHLVKTDLTGPDGAVAAQAKSLIDALALHRQPHQDLMALYQGWMDCLTAAEVAHITGRFRLADDATEAAARRESLRTYQRLEQEATRLRHQAGKERQIAKQVDLNLALQRLQADLNEARARL